MTYRILIHHLSLLSCMTILSCVAAACGNKDVAPDADNRLLVSVGDSSLMLSDVVRRIPHDLDPIDSARMFNSIVDAWVRNMVLNDVAEKNIPDMQRIERMVENYRNSLIVEEYLNIMSEQSSSEISEQEVKDYYDAHREELVLKQPLVKGAYLRVDENSRQLDNLRKWMAEFTDKSFDNIEREGLDQATGYEYFRDEWHEWSEVADMIPYRFFDADAFVKSTRNFETTAEGSVYLLHISEYMLSGAEMPYEFARNKIRSILNATSTTARRDKLKQDIYRKKIKEGVLKPGLYDPLKGEMKNIEQSNS